MRTKAYWVLALGVALVFGTAATTLGWDRPNMGPKSRTNIKRQDPKKRVRKSAPKSVKIRSSSGKDIHSVTQKVLSESYKQTQQDLKTHADKTKAFNRMKRNMRNQTQEMRRKLGTTGETATGSSKPTKATFGPKMVVDKSTQVIVPSERPAASIGDETQLKNVHTQNTLKKQQKTIETMNNVSKNLHETVKKVIKKMGN
jgi:hypothetical protein